MKKTWIISFVLAVFTAGTFLMVFLSKKTEILVAQEARKPVAVSETPTLKELLKALTLIEPYMRAGAKIGGSQLRTVDDKGRYQTNLTDQKIILSNRIFRECLRETRLLSEIEAARLIEKEIKETLPLYIDASKNFLVSEPRIICISDSKDGKPVLSGLRYKLLALLLIAGDCELTGIHETVRRVAQIALDQKESVSEFNDSHLQFSYMANVSLCSPIALSAGLYGTSPHKDLPEAAPYAERYAEYQYTDYSGSQTEFDIEFDLITTIPKEDIIDLRFFESATDEDVIALLALGQGEKK